MSAASDIPAYDRQGAVPWNSEKGDNIAPDRTPVPLMFGTDIIHDPADPKPISDPAYGYDSPGTRVSEV